MKAWLLLAGCGFIPGMDSLALELCANLKDAQWRQLVEPVDAEFYLAVSQLVHIQKSDLTYLTDGFVCLI